MMLLTLRGTPFLYYGEEIGMRDGVIPPDRVCDPVGKRFPSVGRDPERTPMHWNAEPGAGFTGAADPWLPIGPDVEHINVAAQTNDPQSLLSFYRRMIWYRKGSAPLTRGAYRAVEAPADVFAFVRELGDKRLLVALNFASEPRTVTLANAGYVELSTDPTRPAGAPAGASITLGPVEGTILAVA